MAGKGLANVYITDGRKSVPLNRLPEEAWTFITGGTNKDEGAIREHFDGVPWLYRGVISRASKVASVPFSIVNAAGDEVDKSEDYQNALGWLPDPWALLALTEGALCLHGRAYWLKQFNVAGRPVRDEEGGVRWLAPSTMRPKADKERGIIGYIRTLSGQQLPMIDKKSIVAFNVPSFFDELKHGTSPAMAALSAAGVLLNVDKFASAFFERGGIKITLLGVPPDTPKPERERIESWWKRVTQGIKNAWNSAVLAAGKITPTVIGEGIKELSDQELTKEKREDIATALGVPQSVLFSTGGINRAISVQDAESYYTDTIIPETQMIERVANAQLFVPLGYRLKFNPQALSVFQEDETARSAALYNIVQAGETLDNAYDILGYDLPQEVIDRREQARVEAAAPMSFSDNGNLRHFEDHLDKWRRKSLKRLAGGGKADCPFESEYFHPTMVAAVRGALSAAKDAGAVEAVFADAAEWRGYP